MDRHMFATVEDARISCNAGPDELLDARWTLVVCHGSLKGVGNSHSAFVTDVRGIGQPERLAALGIGVAHESPGVGENLQDHLQIRTVFRIHDAGTLNTLANSAVGKLRNCGEGRGHDSTRRCGVIRGAVQ